MRDVILPQLPQTPCPKGVCYPPYDEPTEPWCGFGSEEEMWNFFSERIPTYEEHSVANTEKLVEKETKSQSPIEDMERYIHTVLDSDDDEAKKCKLEHNTALAINTQMHIIHDNLEHLSDLDKGKIEEMEKNYDPKSEDIFKEVWDLSDTSEDESIVKNLYEELAKLDIQTVEDSDNSESSAETVIEAEKRELSPEKEKCEKFP